MVYGIFLFCVDLELFVKLKKDLVSTHSLFTLLLITQDLNKIKNSLTPFFVDNTRKKTCAKFQQKILNSLVIEVHQSFRFFRPKT